MQDRHVAAHVAVRMDDNERNAVAEIIEALRTPLCLLVTLSDTLRAGVRELHPAVVRERGTAVGQRR